MNTTSHFINLDLTFQKIETPIEWIEFKDSSNKKIRYDNLKNTFVQFIITENFHHFGQFVSDRNFKLKIISSEINFMFDNKVQITFGKKLSISSYINLNEFDLVSYENNVDIEVIDVDTISVCDIKMPSFNPTHITFNLQTHKDTSVYKVQMKTNSAKCHAISKDKTQEIICNGNKVIYLIKSDKRYFKGMARCLPEDTFDFEKGVQIAKLKAEIKQKQYDLNNLIK